MSLLTVFDMDGVFTREKSSWRALHRTFGIDNSDLVRKYVEGKITDVQFLDEDIIRWRKAGITKNDIRTACDNIPLTPGASECVNFFNQRGITAIISGGIDMLAHRIAKLGIAYVFANGIVFSGEIPQRGIVRVPLREKERGLLELMNTLGVEKEDVVVIGDTMYDNGMFSLAGTAIAFNAHDGIVDAADFVVDGQDMRELIVIGTQI